MVNTHQIGDVLTQQLKHCQLRLSGASLPSSSLSSLEQPSQDSLVGTRGVLVGAGVLGRDVGAGLGVGLAGVVGRTAPWIGAEVGETASTTGAVTCTGVSLLLPDKAEAKAVIKPKKNKRATKIPHWAFWLRLTKVQKLMPSACTTHASDNEKVSLSWWVVSSVTATEGTNVALTNDSTSAACSPVAAAAREIAVLSTPE
jgi:hypothetical protein